VLFLSPTSTKSQPSSLIHLILSERISLVMSAFWRRSAPSCLGPFTIFHDRSTCELRSAICSYTICLCHPVLGWQTENVSKFCTIWTTSAQHMNVYVCYLAASCVLCSQLAVNMGDCYRATYCRQRAAERPLSSETLRWLNRSRQEIGKCQNLAQLRAVVCAALLV